MLAYRLLVIWRGEHLRNDYIVVLAETEHIVTLVCCRAGRPGRCLFFATAANVHHIVLADVMLLRYEAYFVLILVLAAGVCLFLHYILIVLLQAFVAFRLWHSILIAMS